MKNVTYINASAGSGKTYKLTHQLAELVSEGKVKPEQVIMTTFTVKAATEMKERAKQVLYEKGCFAEAARLDQALIGTIHSVANALIKKYWFFLGLSPDMGVMADEDTEFYISQSLSDLPTQEELKQLNAFSEDFDIQHQFGTGKYGTDYDFWKRDLQSVIAYTTNYELDSYERSIEESLAFIRQFVHPDLRTDYTKAELTAVLSAQVRFAQAQKSSNKKKEQLSGLGTMWRGVDHPTISWYKRLYKHLCAWTGCGFGAENMRDNLAQLWHWPLVYEKQAAYIRLLFALAARWQDRYSRYKKEKNLIDYNDMEKYLRNLLADEQLAAEIAMDYHYLFVDEYQDCSPIQVKIFDRLSELMEHSYWVGDYKQAIYGFRGSDITLTKAVVDRIATGENGCEMAKPLDTSYRSLPDIVRVCNETFKKTFADELDEQSIVLKEHRTNDDGIHSLRYWDLREENPGLAQHIAALIRDGVNPRDIAVLGRFNEPLNQTAGTLSGAFGIPASREDQPLSTMSATPLVLSLLALVESEKDSLAKAQIALLTEQGRGTKELIESKLLFDADESAPKSEFLNDVPLVKRLLELRPQLRQQSLASLVETMIIELDLYNEVKKTGNATESESCLNTIIRTAYTYEQHCEQMNLPATVSGFTDYLTLKDPVGSGDAYGVQLHTYHSSKGLQWKYVILTTLGEKVDNAAKCVMKNLYGVHFHYTEQPSATTPYPEVYIQVLPYVYGTSGKKKVPDDIEQQIEETPLFKKVRRTTLSENNRLLYVGMTRPRDVLILALEKPAKYLHSLQWLQDVGMEEVNADAGSDLLGVGMDFEDATLQAEEAEQMTDYRYEAADGMMKTRRIPYQKPHCEAAPKYLSPSRLQKKGQVTATHQLCERMKHGTLVGKTMTDVGNCIHQLYCSIEQNIENEQYYRNLINSYGLSGYLTDPQDIRKAWEELVRWLTEQYGEATHVYHERPFTHLKDGQVYTGSIDLVWQTANGDIVIDFKTCPLGHEYILHEDSEHYAGWYAGQLDAYTDALEAAGEKVLKRFIYYPVSGLLCEIGREANTPHSVLLSEDNSLAISVSAAQFDALDSGAGHEMSVDVHEGTYESVLENIKGHLMLCCDEMPNRYYHCYFWNGGFFPYVIKQKLQYILLIHKKRQLLLRITGHTTTVKQRYALLDDGSFEPDDNGDACKWTIHFDVEKCPGATFVYSNSQGEHPKTYLLRWNPGISSFKLHDYRRAITRYPDGFHFNWSVYEWENAHKGDRFYMLRTGDDKAGIVFRGVFTSEPYPGDDWAGKGRQRYYMDMDCNDCAPADALPPLSVEELEKALPGIDWRRGHSGQLLSKEDADVLERMWENLMQSE